MNQPNESDSSYQELPAADLKISGEPQPVTIFGYPVVLPDEDINDKVVPIRGKDLKRWRAKLFKISKMSFRCDDLFLAVSMLLIGSWVAFLLTGTVYSGFPNFLLQTLLPVFGFGFLISYFFLRRRTIASPKDISNELLGEIPNPDKIDTSGGQNESK